MAHLPRRFVLAASLGFIAPACDTTPTTPNDAVIAEPAFAAASKGGAERIVEEAVYNMSDTYIQFRCSATGEVLDDDEGELVRLHGSIYERFTVVRTPAGSFHTTWHTMPIGLGGVGQESGEVFRVREAEHGNANQTMNGTAGSYRQTRTLVGRDTGRRLTLVFSGTYRIDANDNFVVQKDRERIECRA